MPIGALEDKRARPLQRTPRLVPVDASQGRLHLDDNRARPRRSQGSWQDCRERLRARRSVYESDRTKIIWTADNIREFCSVASLGLQAALLLALRTGQRQGDLLRLTWKDYDGRCIRLRQSKGRGRKGRRYVTIPVGAPLKTALIYAH